MMFKPGPVELLIVFAIILLVFGVGRIGKIGGELGTGIRSFKDALQGGKKDEAEKSENNDTEK